MQTVLNDNASASGALDGATEKYSELINRLGQEFEDRFCDFDTLEACVSFILNPFIQVDMTCIAEQLSAAFSLDATKVQKFHTAKQIHLESFQGSPNFRYLADTAKYKGVCTELCMLQVSDRVPVSR